MTDSTPPGFDRAELARAVGSLLWKDPERILDAVSRLRGSDAVIECGLRGASMEPAIPRGSALRIDLGRPAPYSVGEVVAFVQDSGICVHRVSYLGDGKRRADFLITQGDACFYPDPPVSMRQVLGPVVAYRGRDGWVATGNRFCAGRARSLPGRMLLALVALLMELNVTVARGIARALRFRKEHAMVTDPSRAGANSTTRARNGHRVD